MISLQSDEMKAIPDSRRESIDMINVLFALSFTDVVLYVRRYGVVRAHFTDEI